jgi:hypothetical protein
MIIYALIDTKETLSSFFGKMALSIDITGNVMFSGMFNDWLATGYKFGNRKETISSVLGKNKRDGTLTGLGTSLANILDFIDENHCIKSIDNNV